MAKVRSHLHHAPIIEALIDLQLQPRTVDLPALREFATSLEGYKVQGPILQFQSMWEFTTEGVRDSSAQSEAGVRLHSSDEKFVLQLQHRNFTLSRLAPYETWDGLVRETRRLWTLFSAQVTPIYISRLATRYINQLKLPLKHDEQFESYLTTPPAVPSELPQTVKGFMQRVVIQNVALGASANVIQLLQEGQAAPADHVPVLLDIDVYKLGQFPPAGDEVWQQLGGLRTFKNEIFFASLTEKAVEIFE